MIDCRDIPFTMVKHEWCDSAARGLSDTYGSDGNMERIASGVRSGRMELFRVNDDSWAVTEIMRGMLFIWCYQGRGAVPFVKKMCILAKANGLSQVSFFSQRKGAARAWKCFNPRVVTTEQTGEHGEFQYIFEVEA